MSSFDTMNTSIGSGSSSMAANASSSSSPSKPSSFLSSEDLQLLCAACSSQEACVRAVSPLKYVAYSSYPDVHEVRRILTKYPKINVDQLRLQIHTGKTPLHLGAISGSHEIVIMLLGEHNASVNVLDRKLLTPLHDAAKEGHTELVALLTGTYKADPNLESKYGKTPLHYACREGHLKTIAKLIENGASLDIDDVLGNTPLHIAAEAGQLDVVKRLVTTYHQDANCRNEADKLPLDLAQEAAEFDDSCKKVVQYLDVLKKPESKPVDTDPGLSIILKKKGGRIKSTKERLFESHGDTIVYKDRELYETKGEIRLEDIVDVTDYQNGWFKLITRGLHRGKFELCAHSKADYDAFVNFLVKKEALDPDRG
eukprot:gb/GECG01016784.1/.p1 GENE.gb/GECG01016784.1/~~gb/GECG01016784.1/.p1  ORF type:complete len:369 (+),score=43.95 gb/GECG01016784.1/:1-1107(+)